MPKARFIFVLPIIALYVSALVLLVVGFIETFAVIVDAISQGEGHVAHVLKLHFVETIDLFLLATILYMIATGFYQLFLGRHLDVPPWLRVESVHDLESMLLSVVITLLGVTALATVMSWDGKSDLMSFGVTVGLVIFGLAFLLTRSTKH